MASRVLAGITGVRFNLSVPLPSIRRSSVFLVRFLPLLVSFGVLIT